MAPSLANLAVIYFPYLEIAVAAEHKNNPLHSRLLNGQISFLIFSLGLTKKRLRKE
jgi:hypothetical protein